MIERYQTKEMRECFSEEKKYASWLVVENAVLKGLATEKILPEKEVNHLLKKSMKLTFDHTSLLKMARYEAELKHDVLAFTTYCAEKLGKEGRFFHFGMTSTDIVDTALSLRIQSASTHILEAMNALMKVLKKRALEFKNHPTRGRTHGMAAEPTSFGLKFLSFYSEMNRNREDLFR